MDFQEDLEPQPDVQFNELDGNQQNRDTVQRFSRRARSARHPL